MIQKVINLPPALAADASLVMAFFQYNRPVSDISEKIDGLALRLRIRQSDHSSAGRQHFASILRQKVMAEVDCFVAAEIKGSLRRMVSVREKITGDVYITIRSGIQVGYPPNHIPIREQRISIHLTPNSLDTNVIKHHVALTNGDHDEKNSATRVVKILKGLFTPLFFCKFSNLKGEYYDLSRRARLKSKPVIYDHHDPDISIAIIGLFVGAKAIPFLPNGAVINTRKFSIGILFTRSIGLPSNEEAKSVQYISPPKIENLSDEENLMRLDFVTAFDPSECNQLQRFMSSALAINHLDTMAEHMKQLGLMQAQHKQDLGYRRAGLVEDLGNARQFLRFAPNISSLINGSSLPPLPPMIDWSPGDPLPHRLPS